MTYPCTSAEVAAALLGCGFQRRFGTKEYVVIDSNTLQSCFKIEGVNGDLMLPQHNSAYAEIRRKGLPALLITYPLVSYDENGFACFTWDNNLFNQPVGFYVADIYINCCYCFSINIRLRRCSLIVSDSYSLGDETCKPICGNSVGAPVCDDATALDDCGGQTPSFSPSPALDIPPPIPQPDQVFTGGTCCDVDSIGDDTIGTQ